MTATVLRTDPGGTPLADPVEYPDLIAAVRTIEEAEHPRWGGRQPCTHPYCGQAYGFSDATTFP
ncbi:hypothetical protein GCM10020255_017580 [Rhodococcus baikonurensis]